MSTLEVKADVTGTIWKILVEPGAAVSENEAVAIIEAMKMEIPVVATDSGTVAEISVKEGESVNEGDTVVTLNV